MCWICLILLWRFCRPVKAGEPWFEGCLTGVGDCAHATRPDLMQGGAMAVEVPPAPLSYSFKICAKSVSLRWLHTPSKTCTPHVACLSFEGCLTGVGAFARPTHPDLMQGGAWLLGYLSAPLWYCHVVC